MGILSTYKTLFFWPKSVSPFAARLPRILLSRWHRPRRHGRNGRGLRGGRSSHGDQLNLLGPQGDRPCGGRGGRCPLTERCRARPCAHDTYGDNHGAPRARCHATLRGAAWCLHDPAIRRGYPPLIGEIRHSAILIHPWACSLSPVKADNSTPHHIFISLRRPLILSPQTCSSAAPQGLLSPPAATSPSAICPASRKRSVRIHTSGKNRQFSGSDPHSAHGQ